MSHEGSARARNEIFYKQKYQENVRFLRRVPKMRHLALEAPGLEMRDFIKRHIKDMLGF